MNTTLLKRSGKAGILLAAAMFTLTSCDPFYGYGGGYGYNNYGSGYGGYGSYGYPAGLRPYVPLSVNSYNYSYYPRYGAYYHRPSGQYHYMSGNRWMSGPSLPGYSPRIIQSSHSVPFNFNSHPSNFHSQVSHAFPHSWTPPGGGSPGRSGGWGSGGGNSGWSGSHGGNGSWGGSGHHEGHRH